MSHPIGYFTACPQGEALTLLFGEDLNRLSQIDQTALLAILAQFIYQNTAFADGYPDRILLSEAALDAIREDNDPTTDSIQAAVVCLENISKDEAIAIIAFLVQP